MKLGLIESEWDTFTCNVPEWFLYFAVRDRDAQNVTEAALVNGFDKLTTQFNGCKGLSHAEGGFKNPIR